MKSKLLQTKSATRLVATIAFLFAIAFAVGVNAQDATAKSDAPLSTSDCPVCFTEADLDRCEAAERKADRFERMKAVADDALAKADKAQQNADESTGALRIVDIDRQRERDKGDELVAKTARLEVYLYVAGAAAIIFGGLAAGDAAGVIELDF